MYNFYFSAKASDNESVFSKLTPKRFFSKHSSPSLSRNSPFAPLSQMSPEFSTAEMSDTPSGIASRSADFIETNNNEIQICIMAQKEEENGDIISAKKDEVVVATVPGENTMDRINDSKIEAILKQHRLQEPLQKIEESTILSPEDTENNSGYKSDSALGVSDKIANKGAKKKLKKGVRVDVEENVKVSEHIYLFRLISFLYFYTLSCRICLHYFSCLQCLSIYSIIYCALQIPHSLFMCIGPSKFIFSRKSLL